MKPALLQWLRCSRCQTAYKSQPASTDDQELMSGSLCCECDAAVPIVGGVPRFVTDAGYAKSFGFEWQRHRYTQLDSANHSSRSSEAFQPRLDSPLASLKDQLVLDAGCGMGRYSEVLARIGAEVVSVDRSEAASVAHENLHAWPNAHVVQADLLNLPFAPETFDLVFSFGVIHHTPNPEAVFQSLARLVKPGGKLAIFVYSAYNKPIVHASAFWRSITTRLPRPLLHALCLVSVPLYYVYRVPVVGHLGKACLIISMEPDWRWRWLDTFDWYSAAYQSKHTHAEVFRWFESMGLTSVKIFNGEVTMLGQKPVAPQPEFVEVGDHEA